MGKTKKHSKGPLQHRKSHLDCSLPDDIMSAQQDINRKMVHLALVVLHLAPVVLHLALVVLHLVPVVLHLASVVLQLVHSLYIKL